MRLCIKCKQLLFLQYLMVLLLAARIIDTQHGDEAVRLEDIGAQCPGRDLLQQAVAGPQVAAGVRALALQRKRKRAAFILASRPASAA